MKVKTSHFEILVPRSYFGDRKTHVLVKLTVVHDRGQSTFIRSAFLSQATQMLSRERCLPDKCEFVLSETAILTDMLVQHIGLLDANLT